MGDAAHYRSLEVWKLAMEAMGEAYRLSAGFPREERFGLTGQLRRAALSVPCNIAEGSSRGTRRDYASFVSIATGSAAETETLLLAAVQLGFVDEGDATSLLGRLDRIGRMLRSLRRRLLEPAEPGRGSPSPIPHPPSP